MPDIESDWVGKNIDELIDYYSKSLLEGQGGLDLKSQVGETLRKKNPNRVIKYTHDNIGIIDFYCLRDANEYFNKAIYSFLCYKYLQLGGYDSWSTITFYYPRFYLNVALCRLQGNATFHGKPPIELIRTDWNKRNYGYKRATIKSGPHVHIWDRAKEYYKNFDIRNMSSITNEELKSFFDDEYYKKYGIENIRREELDDRNNITYGATGFDELYYTPESNYPIRRAYYEGEKNFIDPDVFRHESNVEFFDGTGVEEAGLGALIMFVIELLGSISKSIKNGSNICYIRKETFQLLKTNPKALDKIIEWSNKYGLNCI